MSSRGTRLCVPQPGTAEAHSTGDDRIPERPQVIQLAQLDARRGVAAQEVTHRLGRAERLDWFNRDVGMRLG
jgi:hypothetical protein